MLALPCHTNLTRNLTIIGVFVFLFCNLMNYSCYCSSDALSLVKHQSCCCRRLNFQLLVGVLQQISNEANQLIFCDNLPETAGNRESWTTFLNCSIWLNTLCKTVREEIPALDAPDGGVVDGPLCWKHVAGINPQQSWTTAPQLSVWLESVGIWLSCSVCFGPQPPHHLNLLRNHLHHPHCNLDGLGCPRSFSAFRGAPV